MARSEGPQQRLSSLHELLNHPLRASPSPSTHLDRPPNHNTYHDRRICPTPMNDVQSHHINKPYRAERNFPCYEPAYLHQLPRSESLEERTSHFAPTTYPRIRPLIPMHLSYSLPSLLSLPPLPPLSLPPLSLPPLSLPPLSLPPLLSVPPVPSPPFPANVTAVCKLLDSRDSFALPQPKLIEPVNSCAPLPQLQSGSIINDNLIARGPDQHPSSSLEMEVTRVESTHYPQSADQSCVPRGSTSYDFSVGNECPITVDEEPLNLSHEGRKGSNAPSAGVLVSGTSQSLSE
jgi:hypothetical protein